MPRGTPYPGQEPGHPADEDQASGFAALTAKPRQGDAGAIAALNKRKFSRLPRKEVEDLASNGDVDAARFVASSRDTYSLGSIMRHAAYYGHAEVVRELLKVTTQNINQQAFDAAALNGCVEVLQLLVGACNPKDKESAALGHAALEGHYDAVKMLIAVSDPRAGVSKALRMAAGAGHEDIVDLLIPHSDPRANHCHALRYAAKNGHLAIVKKLIPLSDPSELSDTALLWAAEKGHIEVVDLLLPVSANPRAIILSARATPSVHAIIQAYLDDQELRKSHEFNGQSSLPNTSRTEHKP